MTIDLDSNLQLNAKICVVGVGGAGGNAVDNMIKRGIDGVTFIAANTDKQALDRTNATEKILLGENFTKGLGAGAKPEIGKKAAEESSEILKSALEGYDLIFVTCGMGGGTGTGGSPIIAKIAKDTNALVVGIVSKCFTREGTNKTQLADTGISALKENVDAIIVVPNDKILEVCKDVRLRDAHNKANDILYNAVRGIVDIIVRPSYENVDFADIRTTLANVGEVIIGLGTGKGENAPKDAVQNALNSPFFDGLSIKQIDNSSTILLYIQDGGNYFISHTDDAKKALKDAVGNDDVHIITGYDDSDNGNEEFMVTIIAPAQKNDTSKNNSNNKKATVKDEKKTTVSEEEPEVPVAETKPLRAKKTVTPTVNKVNLFDEDKHSGFSQPSDLINFGGRIKNVAASVERENTVESLEIIAGPPQFPQTIGRFGRPREEELKDFDVPAYMRRGGESKYNTIVSPNEIINNASLDTNISNTISDDEERQKIQHFVNSITDKPSDRFMRHLSDKGLSFKR